MNSDPGTLRHPSEAPASQQLERAPRISTLLHIVLVGLGNIGSFLIALIARDARVGEVTLVDHDRFTEDNLYGQAISLDAVGELKVDWGARELRRVRPDLRVNTIPLRVEHAPRGQLRGSLMIGALDSKGGRSWSGEIARALGMRYLDLGVHAELECSRITLLGSGVEDACIECDWRDEDYANQEVTFPCQEGQVSVESSYSTSMARTHNNGAALGAATAALGWQLGMQLVEERSVSELTHPRGDSLQRGESTLPASATLAGTLAASNPAPTCGDLTASDHSAQLIDHTRDGSVHPISDHLTHSTSALEGADLFVFDDDECAGGDDVDARAAVDADDKDDEDDKNDATTNGNSIIGREHVFHLGAFATVSSRRRRNSECRAPHRRQQLQQLHLSETATLADLTEGVTDVCAESVADPATLPPTEALSVQLPGLTLATRFCCPGCDRETSLYRLVERLGLPSCDHCESTPQLELRSHGRADLVSTHNDPFTVLSGEQNSRTTNGIPQTLLVDIGLVSGDHLRVSVGKQLRMVELVLEPTSNPTTIGGAQ